MTKTCGCCGQSTVPPTPDTDEEGHYCEGCGVTWDTPTGPDEPLSCDIHNGRIRLA